MGLLDWLKQPEVAFLLGMPVGYVVIDYGRKKLSAYIKETGQEIGKNIAVAMKTQTNGGYELSQEYQLLDKKLDSLLSKVSEIEKKVYQGGEK